MQRYGVPMGFGGPHAAYMATRDAHKRALPGRLVGVSVDANGRRAYRLALQTREQHIRREKATSNICTAQVLLAVIASMYAVFHGPAGLKAIAARVHRDAVRLGDGLTALGFAVEPEHFFDTITVRVGALQGVILAQAVANGVNLRKVGADRIGITVDERTRPDILQAVWRAFGAADPAYDEAWPDHRLPEALVRTSAYLTHPIFHMNRAESEMTRYMRRLSDRDLALDRAMIPLGSCTMKLNATAEMLPISWPEFSEIHPFVPADQAAGYHELIDDLSRKLCAITGYDAVSMQPNSGAQGEYAGLLAIRRYHLSRGDAHRTICLIPSSAHGTNPASAQMCGHERGGGRRRRQRQHRRGGFPPEGRAACRQARGLHDHLSLDPRRVRGARPRTLRHRPRPGRPGLSRRRQPQRAGRAGAAGRHRRRRQPPEPAQDLLHPAWRRRARHGADRRQGAPDPVPAHRSALGRGGGGLGGGLRLGLDPADLVELLPDDGRPRPRPGDPGRDPQRQLHRRPAQLRLSDPLCRRQGPGRARMHRRRAPVSEERRHHRRRHRQAPDRLRLPRRRP